MPKSKPAIRKPAPKKTKRPAAKQRKPVRKPYSTSDN
jgi:hypothetical protein